VAQVACLLANAFFCTYPRRNTDTSRTEYEFFPSINFSTFVVVVCVVCVFACVSACLYMRLYMCLCVFLHVSAPVHVSVHAPVSVLVSVPCVFVYMCMCVDGCMRWRMPRA
jgi:hypothetical protein